MKVFLCVTFYCALILGEGRSLDSLDLPDVENIGCLTKEDSVHLLEYNKLEVVNNLRKHSLADLLGHRGITVENNPKYNGFLYCIWKKEQYLMSNDEIDYNKLEQIVTDAIVRVVGRTGPAINLSMAFSSELINECRAMTEFKVENKIVKIQNHIITKLQPFSKL